MSIKKSDMEEGYDVILVDSAKGGLICPECNKVLRDAVQTSEGYRLCQNCFKKIELSPGFKSGKTDISILDEDGKPSWYPDKAVRREVVQLLVKCHNCPYGCKWTGPLLDYFENHHTECEFKPVSCPNEGCMEMVLSKNLEKHQREECFYHCEHCNDGKKLAQLKDHQENCRKPPITCNCCETVDKKGYDIIFMEEPKRELMCPECNHVLREAVQTQDGVRLCLLCCKKLSGLEIGSRGHSELKCHPDAAARREVKQLKVRCEHGCKWTGPLSVYFEKHLNSCPNILISCRVCNKKLPREEVDEHQISQHYLCFCGEQFDQKESIISHLAQPDAIVCHMTKLFYELKKQEKKHNEDMTRFYCDTSYLKKTLEQVVQQMLQLTDRGEPRTIKVGSDDSESRQQHEQLGQVLSKFFENLQVPLSGSQTQVQNQPPAHIVDEGTSAITDMLSSRLVDAEERNKELEKQMSMLKVHVSELELQLQMLKANTHNGSFLWRIPNISRRRCEAVENRIISIYSPPFYTSSNGYKMRIRAYLNGDGMGYKSHFSLFFEIMKGEFDALLKWPFDHQVTLIVVDQNHDNHIVQTFEPISESSSFQRPVFEMNVASGCPQFADLSILDDTSYIKEDILFIKCIVDTTRIFHS